ncbi:hypothetical protein B0H13DRAFT_2539482 [Mycena leptocephala]|nr:hypothetical protein B0H13DRAFT_2539482 [Mycena leptocephala]
MAVQPIGTVGSSDPNARSTAMNSGSVKPSSSGEGEAQKDRENSTTSDLSTSGSPSTVSTSDAPSTLAASTLANTGTVIPDATRGRLRFVTWADFARKNVYEKVSQSLRRLWETWETVGDFPGANYKPGLIRLPNPDMLRPRLFPPTIGRCPSSPRLVPTTTYKLAVDPSELPPTGLHLSSLQMTRRPVSLGSLTAVSRARMNRPDVCDACTFTATSSHASAQAASFPHPVLAEATRGLVVLKAALPLWYLRELIAEYCRKRMAAGSGCHALPAASRKRKSPTTAMLCSRQASRRPSQLLLARPTTPLSPRSSTSPIIERSSPPPSLLSSRESSSATQGGAGVRTNDIALSILTLCLSPGT